ncbi:S8 family serine peptidase [Bacteriovoracaceae bacterium]|nr:S8 family serine peptidase [Bacteriovoracaceae bacterium]
MRFLIITLSLFININLLLAQKWKENKWHLNSTINQVTIDIDDIHFKQKTVHPGAQLNMKALGKMKPATKIKIAIIDGGIDHGHEDLIDYLSFKESECYDKSTIPEMKDDKDGNGIKGDCLGFNFFGENNLPEDEDGHGTHVAGLITEPFVINNSNHLEILPIKIFGQDKRKKKNLRTLINQAIRYAINEEVQIIHLSMGWPHSLHTAKIDDALKLAQEKNILIVSSAGNSGQFASIYPCQISNVVCVGALDVEGKPAIFSNHGKNVDFYFPGEKILSTIPSNTLSGQLGIRGIGFKSGTSQAAPLLSGILAFVKSANPLLSWPKILNNLKDSIQFDKNQIYNIDLDRLSLSILENKLIGFITPNLKNLELSLLQNELVLNIPFAYSGKKQQIKTKLNCHNGLIFTNEIDLPSDQRYLTYNLKNSFKNKELLNCQLTIGDFNKQYLVNLPLYKNIQESESFLLPEKLSKKIIKTRAGIAVKFYSIPAIAQSQKKAYFFSSGDKKIQIYFMNQFIQEISFKKECRVLRLWQRNGEQTKDELIVEKLCKKKYIQYDFYSVSLKKKIREIQFFPKKTIVNYDNLVIKEGSNEIIFEYLSPAELTIEQKTIFSTIDLPSSTRLVHLTASKDNFKSTFSEKITNNIKRWAKDLKYRYIPNYRVILKTNSKILIEIENKYALIDRKTNRAQWVSHLNQFLIGKPKIRLSPNKIILTELITPYDFQFIILNSNFDLEDYGFFQQQNLENPLIEPFVTGESNPIFIIKSFYHLMHLNFEGSQGYLMSKTSVDRFDFLGGVEQQSLLTEVNPMKAIFIVDGSSVHENKFSLYRKNKRINYRIPKECRSLSLIKYLKSSYLPIICWDKKLKLLPLE